jgi:hypothetical protein
LFVSLCDSERQPVLVGSFRDKLDSNF